MKQYYNVFKKQRNIVSCYKLFKYKIATDYTDRYLKKKKKVVNLRKKVGRMYGKCVS